MEASMALRTLSRLKPLTVERVKTVGMHADGGGLYLQVKAATAKSWIFRFVQDGRERHMGLGSASTFTLAEAREAARECRKLLHAGIDPIEHRASGRQQKRLDAAKTIPLENARMPTSQRTRAPGGARSTGNRGATRFAIMQQY
jgi:hypothetical protein